MDTGILVVFAAGTLLIRLGQFLIASGSVRSKNAGVAGARALLDIGATTLSFWAVGFVVFGIATLQLPWRHAFCGDIASSDLLRLLSLILIGPAIATAATAERSRMLLTCVSAAVLGGIVMPLVSGLTASGRLACAGFFDYGGAAPLQLSGAVWALVACILVGPRQGKYNTDGSTNLIPGHQLPMTMTGTLLMLVGWLPYLAMTRLDEPGRSASAAANAILAAAAGMLSASICSRWRYGKVEVTLACSGLIGSLAAISAVGGALPQWGAVLLGLSAGAIVPILSVTLDLIWKIDDPSGLIAAQGAGGVLGLLAAVFLPHESFIKGAIVQLIGILTTFVVAAAAAVVILLPLNRYVGLRVREADEFDGLDLAEHDINAYPDFQQTMIKSYHLREA